VQASAAVTQDTGPHAAYWRFYDAVARAQLAAWLDGPGLVLADISGPASEAAALAAAGGNMVLHVLDPGLPRPGHPAPPEHPVPPQGAGRLRSIAAEGSGLQFLADACVDGVIAEDRTLSRRLVAETLVSEIHRVLRPGGKVLAAVDSLTRGMAVLAEQHHWPHLIDVPHADVVLVPWPDGSITRCYGIEQLRELFASSGLEVQWIRPRTVLSPSTVSYLLARDPGSFRRLVDAELRTSADDSVGGQLVISATKRSAPANERRAGLAAPPVALGLAGHAARGRRTGLQPPLRDRLAAVNALAVAAVLDPRQRRDDLGPLGPGRFHRRLVPVGLREVRARVTCLHAGAAGTRMFPLQHEDRPVQVLAHRLQELAGNANFHRTPRLLPNGTWKARQPPCRPAASSLRKGAAGQPARN